LFLQGTPAHGQLHEVPRVGSKFKLAAIDSADTAFIEGHEDKQRERLEALAVELDELQNLLHAEGRRKLLLVLQGMDTSGKDGTIRWVFSRTSPLGVRVTAFKAPSEEERARDFLWRCHTVVPRNGEIMVWNRSHYEDVLVLGGRRLDRQGRDPAPPCADQRLRALAHRDRHRDRQVHAAYQQGRAARTPAGAHRRTRQALEVQAGRPGRAQEVGRLPACLRTGAGRHLQRPRAPGT
jgi:hypothetical protein